MKNPLRCRWPLLLALLVGTDAIGQNTYTVNRKSQWEQWKFPKGAVELRPEGSIMPVKFEQPFNAALSAPQFIHTLKQQGDVQGGVWRVGSNPARAPSIIDGSLETSWRPDPADPLSKWWLEIDLGRVVAVKEIRLHFPDREGARPLREFRVFGSDGKRQSDTEDIFAFEFIGGTTKWNEQTVVSYPVAFGERTKAVFSLGEAEAGEDTSTAFAPLPLAGAPPPTSSRPEAEAGEDTSTAFAPLQYIRIIADAKSPDAALAEVEVISFGENIAPGTFDRGGFIDDQGKGRTGGMVDGDVNTFWEELDASSAGGYRTQYNWDLGAMYWINRVVFVAFQLHTTWYPPRILGHRLLGSDGSLNPSGDLDFDLLFDYPNPQTYTNPEPLTYRFFPYRRLRNLYMLFGGTSSGAIAEAFVFPVGYVAQVELTSGYIEISSRPKVLQALNWEENLPPGTRVRAQTRSGNTLVERSIYHHKNGTEVTKEKYDSLIKALKGPIDQVIEPGDDWSGWSNTYEFSGQAFLSPSPRRYVQFRVRLSSDRPNAAPELRSLSLVYTEAFLSGAAGEIYPKEASAGEGRGFSYHLYPRFSSGDPGFNRILMKTPSQVEPDSLALWVGGTLVQPTAVYIAPDSLIVELPQLVRQDSVVIGFRAIPRVNPYLVEVSVGRTQQPELWQLADPTGRFATTVFLPQAVDAVRIIADPPLHGLVFTPNNDGIGDLAEIRFSVLKVQVPPKVGVYRLDGRLVQELEGRRDPDQSWVFTWSGRDRSELLVPPGVYLYRIAVDTQSGGENLARTINVVY